MVVDSEFFKQIKNRTLIIIIIITQEEIYLFQQEKSIFLVLAKWWKWRELNSHLEFKKLNIATSLDCFVFSESSLKAIKIRNSLSLL